MASKYLTPEARDYIEEQVHDFGEITTDEVMELVRPHFLFDPETAREQQIRRVAHRIMSAVRGGRRHKDVFRCEQGRRVYICEC